MIMMMMIGMNMAGQDLNYFERSEKSLAEKKTHQICTLCRAIAAILVLIVYWTAKNSEHLREDNHCMMIMMNCIKYMS